MQVTLNHIFAHNILTNTHKTHVEKRSKFSEWKHEETGLWKNIEQLPWNFWMQNLTWSNLSLFFSFFNMADVTS